ncbi:hypothetical protein B296_00036564 [Ensete ventricosum]|uniref:Uncharacterized protein n=1 Tax=Ensete ventricosum TaxID=4639 RepID=A0A426Z8N3_ENSVE|nr:hypothetical protein B296_00036564 [Ensete ventricosum]
MIKYLAEAPGRGATDDSSVSKVYHHQGTSQRERASRRLGQASFLLRDRHTDRSNDEDHRALHQFDYDDC